MKTSRKNLIQEKERLISELRLIIENNSFVGDTYDAGDSPLNYEKSAEEDERYYKEKSSKLAFLNKKIQEIGMASSSKMLP